MSYAIITVRLQQLAFFSDAWHPSANIAIYRLQHSNCTAMYLLAYVAR